jgi:hypothetical protein
MLAKALQRPGFFCGGCGDLMWIEERPESDRDCVGYMLGGSLGVFGQFHFQHHVAVDQFMNEVASTFAEASFRLGYYNPKRLLNEREYEQLVAQLDDSFFQCDHTQSEIISRFGPPSHDVLGGPTTVHCYGTEDKSRPWICFDYSRCYPPVDGITHEWFDEEVLRDIRRDNNKFELLPFACWFQPANDHEDDGEQNAEPELPMTGF